MRFCLLALLPACAKKPVDVVAEIEIIPAKPGDSVELYFGTTPRREMLSEIAADQVQIGPVQAYAVDKIGPHEVEGGLIDISEPLPTLSMVIAVEDDATYAAAAAIDLSADPAPVYLLKLESVDAASGLDAAEWGPLHPKGDQAAKECAYYNGLDANGRSLAAAIVVDTDTATTGTPYVDLDCDGYAAPTVMNAQSPECDDHVYDSVGQASDDSTCISAYPAEDDCLVVGPACTDGQLMATGCPTANDVTAQNLTKWCVPGGYCAKGYASLSDILAMPSSTYGAIECQVQVDPLTGVPCTPIVAMGSTDAAWCTGAPAIDVQIGAGGPPYSVDALMPTAITAEVSVAQDSDPCAIVFSFAGDWTPLLAPGTTATTLMLALTPHGGARGVVLPVAFSVMANACSADMGACTFSLPANTSDPSLAICLNP